MDSLVAVEVRTWFQIELGVDMPVLKVLGGASASDLVDDAVEKLPSDIVASLSGSVNDIKKLSIVVDEAPSENGSSEVPSSPSDTADRSGPISRVPTPMTIPDIDNVSKSGELSAGRVISRTLGEEKM